MRNLFAIFVMLFVSGYTFGAEADTTNPWVPVVGEVVGLILQIVAPALTILITALVWKLLAKFGVEKNVAINNLMKTYIKQGINYADSWAEKQANKPTGDQKMAIAIKHVLSLMADSKLPKIAEEKLVDLVESQLTFDKKQATLPNESNTKDPKVINE